MSEIEKKIFLSQFFFFSYKKVTQNVSDLR